ncbi:hypothetical protein RRG08_028377 [Elysia crispata]|uniref:CCHC-type domain-containing protein n=1 Tax=Elysia crispata TaxID=231223 RepID=A0AAE1B8T9_9GAST|nr:hypothetical protein RRG08_028377 [Elysia crispata]
MSCDFADFLDRALGDKFVCGISNESAIQRLLKAEGSTFKEVADIATQIEIAEKQTASIQRHCAVAAVHQKTVKTTVFKGAKPTCYRCGGEHTADRCRFIKASCRACGKVGHIARACRTTKSKSQPVPANTNRRQHRKQIHAIHQEAKGEPEDCEYLYATTSATNHSHTRAGVTVPLKIQNVGLDFLIDTGASRTLIPEEVLRKNNITLEIKPCSIQFKGYRGQDIPERTLLTGNHCRRCERTDAHPWKELAKVFYNTVLEDLPITPNEIRSDTRRDPVLSKVLYFTLKGWPAKESNPVIMPFFRKRVEISTEFGCLL